MDKATSEGLELLTTDEMGRADRLAIDGGIAGADLMEAAGVGVADEVSRRCPDGHSVVVLCGPGNNGGDGFVAARHLQGRGYSVQLALLGARDRLEGDAALMAGRWQGPVATVEPGVLGGADIVVDALFGAGLARPVEGPAAAVIAEVNAHPATVIAVDVPSGVDGTTGEVRGAAVAADATVTFFRRKPGHVLLPGRSCTGAVKIVDIGIPASVLDDIVPRTFLNEPALWRAVFPMPAPGGHKYDRGHALVVSGGPESTGAARLGARGALRVGSGLVTVASPRAAFPVNAAQLTAIMIQPFEGAEGLGRILDDRRRNGVLIGPGAGVGDRTARLVDAVLSSEAAVVLDADALTTFAGSAGGLVAGIGKRRAPVVLTPHAGEFARLFPETRGSKLEQARSAAAATGAIVILKGPDTVIAEPEGRAAINDNAPPWLATAGSGDVLAGFTLGLLAQHMPAFEAACAAVWLHGAAASRCGAGLIAEDLPEALPEVLRTLLDRDA